MSGNETEQNSLREGKRLEQELENSQPHHNQKSGGDICRIIFSTNSS